VEAHAVEVADCARPQARRLLVARELRLGLWIDSDQPPAPIKKAEEEREAEKRGDGARVGRDPPAGARGKRGLRDDAFREAHHDRHPLARAERARGAERGAALAREYLVARAAPALRPGGRPEPARAR